MKRIDERTNDELRPLKITRNYIKHAEGSVLIEVGETKVICTATVEERVPPFLKGAGKGWITAEYSMLPRATSIRNRREASRGKQGGRTLEIQRLIGRALRSCIDLKKLGERTITLDCDVIQADGGTRTASITGAFVALMDAIHSLEADKIIAQNPIIHCLAATSVGMVKGETVLDLCFEEDSQADVDMNVVMNDKEEFIEIQGTAEGVSFSYAEMEAMLSYAQKGINELIEAQKSALAED